MRNPSAFTPDVLPASAIQPCCIAIRMVKNGGNLRAFASTESGAGLMIRELRVVQPPGPWHRNADALQSWPVV